MTALTDVEGLLWIIMNKIKCDGLVRLGGDIIGFIKKGDGETGRGILSKCCTEIQETWI